MDFSTKNISPEVHNIDPFPPVVEIKQLYAPYLTVRLINSGTTAKTLMPGETVDYTITWDQRNWEGQQVAYGYYYIKLGGLGLDSSIQLLILPPEGAVMEKAIEVNQSQTIDEIRVTLQRVELTSLGMRVYALVSPPSSAYDALHPPDFGISAYADYTIDNGDSIQAFASHEAVAEGIEVYWSLSPVLKDVREMTFNITISLTLGKDWHGPWVFHIPLD